jgi:hypothetical protein
MKLRDYQQQLSTQASEILLDKKIVYLNFSPRVGKTLTALETCKKVNAQKVLFITKIKAFSSIQSDYDDFSYQFRLTIINKESIHKIDLNDFDLVVADEAHGLFSTFPKPNNFYKIYKKRFGHLPIIMLSGTMCVESGSQIFHQFQVSDYSPFRKYTNFYKWAKDFVNIKQKQLGYGLISDYSDCNMIEVNKIIDPYTLRFTQEQSGFISTVNKNILECEMKPIIKTLIDRLLRDSIIEGNGEVIIADTSVAMQQKVHQLGSGTIKFHSGNSKTIDNSKAVFIKEHFKGKKIAIIYYYKEELNMLNEVFKDLITTDLEEFNITDKIFVGQQISSCEGISLARAECLVFLNFGFSGKNFIQAIDRLTLKDRPTNDVYFVFSSIGIDKKIYQSVSKKENYNNSHFKKDYGNSNSRV